MRQYQSLRRYALWPLATWAVYDEDRDTSGAGSSWMAWPLAGAVSRTRETQYLFLPPFFSFVETPERRRRRLPWPLWSTETRADGRTHHSLFWHLVTWHSR